MGMIKTSNAEMCRKQHVPQTMEKLGAFESVSVQHGVLEPLYLSERERQQNLNGQHGWIKY